MSPKFEQSDGFILPACFRIFQFLRYVSLFTLIRAVDKLIWAKKNGMPFKKCVESDEWKERKPFTYRYVFPEIWALSNLMLSILAGVWLCQIDSLVLQVVLLVYAVARTFELFVYQVNVLLFDPIANDGKGYEIKSATRMVILLVMNMVEYTFWFSCIYSSLNFILLGIPSGGYISVLDSFNLFVNLDAPNAFELEHFHILAFIETLLGMFMNLVCLARFIALLPEVKTIDKN